MHTSLRPLGTALKSEDIIAYVRRRTTGTPGTTGTSGTWNELMLANFLLGFSNLEDDDWNAVSWHLTYQSYPSHDKRFLLLVRRDVTH